MLEDIPTRCDRGTKCNAQGYKVSWNGYKLHLDTADCGVPIAALLSSASMHDSRAAERSNARLKDELGGNNVRVQGGTKVMGHLMFGVLALSADQLMRLRQ